MSKKILVLAETIDVDSSSAGKANMGFVQSLVMGGFKVEVLHYSHKEVEVQNAKTTLVTEYKADVNYWLSRSQRVFQRVSKINISRQLEHKFGFSFTFKNDAKSMARVIKKQPHNFDLIITLSKAASFRTHAALLQIPRLHSKWLAYVHDPYPFHCYPPPYNWTESGHIQKEAFFREVSEKAQFSGFPSLRLQEWMGQFFPKFLKTGVVLPHQNISAVAVSKSVPSYIEKVKFSVMHAGSLLDHRKPFALLEGFKKFLENTEGAEGHCQLLLIGASQAHEPKLTELCSQMPQVYKSDGYLNFAEVAVLQKNVTALLILEAVSDVSPFLPGKFPHYIKENKPIIHLGPERSETKRLLGSDYIYSCEANDVKNIEKIISTLYKQWELNNELQLNRPDLEAYCSSEYFIECLQTTLD